MKKIKQNFLEELHWASSIMIAAVDDDIVWNGTSVES
jgi:hypothetical protein